MIGAADVVTFLGLRFDNLMLLEAVAWIRGRTPDARFAYVVTPNVDHMNRLDTLPEPLRNAYREADLCLCDSRVLARLARWCGVRLIVTPGSDLVPLALEEALAPGDRVLLVGGSPMTAAAIATRYASLDIVHHDPPMGLLRDPAARAAAVEAAAVARARLILLAVGSPQQELIAHEMRRDGRIGGTALCIGAAVEFVAGAQRRAPRVVQRSGLEWAWRLALEPRRLFRRYLIDGPAIFPAVWRWRRQRGRAG